ncbi:hypothetical protein SAMN05421852_102402 [Thermoflavimicrobium dichotomicum]|uniref:Uncharacterized protein n=1 Tax=Thermoflavimicrobium dichotomicum TaxID=46223 RepID=A0A1I3M0U3_9BACL|nr:hypothetical protein SAMN05421852_102402 [Thermoflavimicrobium dichotomicum]
MDHLLSTEFISEYHFEPYQECHVSPLVFRKYVSPFYYKGRGGFFAKETRNLRIFITHIFT